MPYVDGTTTPPTPEPDKILITDPRYEGIVVDTRYIPETDLLTHIEGSSWTVDYFSQVLDTDSGVNGQSVNKPAQMEQYRRIQNLELKVTTPLTQSQDETSKQMSYTGGGTIYGVLIPNVGDLFLAHVDDGRIGIFELTTSERKSFYKDSVFTVEYTMLDYAGPERLRDMETKTLETFEYIRDYLKAGQNPLVEKDTWTIIRQLHNRYDSMLKQYTKQFMSKEFKTLIAPGQPYPTYDAWLVRAVTEMFQSHDTPELMYLRQLDVDDDQSMACIQLWKVLLEKDPAMMKFVNQRAGLVWVNRFSRNPMLNGIRWSGVQLVVYPIDPELTVDQAFVGLEPVTDAQLQPTPSRKGRLEDLITKSELDTLPYATAPLIHPVLHDDYYVLSKAFYERELGAQSRLESCVWDYLEDRALDNKLLLSLCDTYHGFGMLEMFYYTPIVLLLIRAAIRRI
ncbi:hypothetical protein [Paraburkholderia sp. BCC1886]|uniref:hypothetical protein n=1 Tax=Paraburkholderia sp. BCC1886 TaxID=2562670 RepID=UPI0011843B24|nr:hypothetical protein [Paraburkholderia sp. BCC1886]